MNKRIAIKDIVDANGNHMNPKGMTRTIGINDLYEFCGKLQTTLNYVPGKNKNLINDIATLITRIKVAYYYKKLQEGEKFTPISLRGNILVDGRQRLWAHLLNNDIEVEYIDTE